MKLLPLAQQETNNPDRTAMQSPSRHKGPGLCYSQLSMAVGGNRHAHRTVATTMQVANGKQCRSSALTKKAGLCYSMYELYLSANILCGRGWDRVTRATKTGTATEQCLSEQKHFWRSSKLTVQLWAGDGSIHRAKYGDNLFSLCTSSSLLPVL